MTHNSASHHAAANAPEFIEVVGEDMQCFEVHPDTLEPIGCSYYEPAALRDPQGRRQMGIGEWIRRRAGMREDGERRL